MRAGAFLTRSGPIAYRRSELHLDGDPNEVVTIERTVESMVHPDTIASLRAAPITIGHPAEDVDPDNYRDLTVGAVAGEPFMQSDFMKADVLIGDREALQRIDSGEDELSIGYRAVIDTETMRTMGPLLVNHVAIVPRGRAGDQVRVLDAFPGDTVPTENSPRPEDEGDPMSDTMTKDEIKDMVDSAVTKAFDAMMRRQGMTEGKDADDARKMRDDFKGLLDEVVGPLATEISEMKQARDADAAAKAQADAEAEAIKAADALRTEVRNAERERFAVLTDAMPLLDEAKVSELADADVKTILVAALGDTIPGAENMSADMLRGALLMAKQQAAATAMTGGDAGTGDGLPAGVRAFDSTAFNGQDARTRAEQSYIDRQAQAYKEAGGR